MRSEPASWPDGLFALVELGAQPGGQALCTAHRGAHRVYLGGCHALPPRRAPYTRPLAVCDEPGCRLATEVPHRHAPPTRVELDVDALASAIVRAAAATRTQRVQERHHAPPAAHAPEAPPVPPDEPLASDSGPAIPGLTVWSVDDDGSRQG